MGSFSREEREFQFMHLIHNLNEDKDARLDLFEVVLLSVFSVDALTQVGKGDRKALAKLLGVRENIIRGFERVYLAAEINEQLNVPPDEHIDIEQEGQKLFDNIEYMESLMDIHNTESTVNRA